MAGSSVLEISGFDDLIQKINNANINSIQAAQQAAKAGANVVKNQLISECKTSGVPNKLISSIRIKEKTSGSSVSEQVGWDVPGYNPRNIADAYKVIFLNYGTPRRTTRKSKQRAIMPDGSWVTLGNNRGEITSRDFIKRAKSRSKSKIKKAQIECLKKILREVQ